MYARAVDNQDQLQRVRQAAINHIKQWNPPGSGGRLHLDDVVARLGNDPARHVSTVYEFFWSLLRDGLAVPWHGDNKEHPDEHIQVSEVFITPYGVQVLTADHPTAHDPTGLLKVFDDLIGQGLDESIRSAFEGALLNFRSIGTYVGCAILLGTANEDLVDDLIRKTRMSDPTPLVKTLGMPVFTEKGPPTG
jgi:hypothetical protein